MAESTWQRMKMNHAVRGFTAIATGIVVTIFLWWFFGGFGFWAFPGLAILFVGIGEIFFVVYMVSTGKKSGLTHSGLLTLFVGVSLYLSLAGHVMLGALQMISLVVMGIGILLSVVGAFLRPKI